MCLSTLAFSEAEAICLVMVLIILKQLDPLPQIEGDFRD